MKQFFENFFKGLGAVTFAAIILIAIAYPFKRISSLNKENTMLKNKLAKRNLVQRDTLNSKLIKYYDSRKDSMSSCDRH